MVDIKKKMAKSSKIILPTLQKHYHDYVVFLSTTEAKMCSSPGYNARKDETFSGAFFFFSESGQMESNKKKHASRYQRKYSSLLGSLLKFNS